MKTGKGRFVDAFKGKTILITGGTGSFGNALMSFLKDTDFKEVRIFSRDELKQEMMRIQLGNPKVKFYLGDVRSRDSVDNAMKNVDLVFHAAALKQVPSCEFFPMEAVLTNVVGSQNVVESAVNHKVVRVVCLSTDKAVYPVNTMGMTKGLMERTSQSFARKLGPDETVVSTLRYGNVMYSRGSVIPLFVNQIKKKKPITITVPHMTRFLLPLQNAIDLLLFTLVNARQGDLFIRKSPACTVHDLALALKKIFNSSVELNTIGIRHGEKIHETLATTEELRKAEDLGDYYRIKMDDRDLNYSKYLDTGRVEEAMLEDYTSSNTRQLNMEEIERLLLSLPEIRADLEEMKRL